MLFPLSCEVYHSLCHILLSIIQPAVQIYLTTTENPLSIYFKSSPLVVKTTFIG